MLAVGAAGGDPRTQRLTMAFICSAFFSILLTIRTSQLSLRRIDWRGDEHPLDYNQPVLV